MTGISTQRQGQIVVHTVCGEVSLDEIADYVERNMDSWAGDPVIWELSAMDFRPVTTESLREFIQRVKPLAPRREGRRTALACSSDLAYGMMRVLEILVETAGFGVQLRTFRTIEEAKRWLVE